MPRASDIAVVVLAAGAGSRMGSRLAKPLHPLAGAPLLAHALAAAASLGPAAIAVVAPDADGPVAAAARAIDPAVVVATQPTAAGTGDAARRGLAALGDAGGRAVVIYADTPLLRPETLAALADAATDAAVAVLGFPTPPPPNGYGRLVTDDAGTLARIVEAADATPAELAAALCNAGAMAFDAAAGRRWLERLGRDNARGEAYLTDLVGAARAEGRRCVALPCAAEEAMGVNTRRELAAAEAAFQRRARLAALDAGAALQAPETVFLAFDTRLGRDAAVGPNVVFGPGVTVEPGAEIRAFSHLEGCVVRAGAVVGPFARLRPGAEVGPGAHVGNFVEVKNAVLGAGAKANHLAYLGDATVGAGANIGAGAITCNYDGVAKHRTEIGDGAFIGSNAALVAPVAIGSGAYVASGSVVTEDVPADALAIGRARQTTRPGLGARLRARLGARLGGRLGGRPGVRSPG